MRRLLVATHNPGKVAEYRQLLSDLPLQVTYLDQEGIDLEVPETGATLAENAVQKATAYAAVSGLWTWADDSGLQVDALGGAPGVRSNRYAGPGASDEDRYRKLLRELQAVPWAQRTARFQCVVAIVVPKGAVLTASGSCEGIIGYEPKGSFGFGYDPVFFMPSVGQTMAELAPEVKNQISHRARAAAEAKRLLQRMLESPAELPFRATAAT